MPRSGFAWPLAPAAVLRELHDFDWNDLGRAETIGAWPAAVMALLVLALFCACLAAGYGFDIRALRLRIELMETEEAGLRAELRSKATLAADLEGQRERVADLELAWAALLRQLPAQNELPALLEDISASGLDSGLQFAGVHVRGEVLRDHYLELPIDIEVLGGYHDFGQFVSGVARLARIVTLHDFTVQSIEGDHRLSMSISARTYRYRPEEGR